MTDEEIYNLDYQRVIRQNEDYNNYTYLTFNHFTTNFLREYRDRLNWKVLSESQQTLTLKQMDEFSDYLYWDSICRTQQLTEEFCEKYSEKVNWNIVLAYQINVSLDFIKRHGGH